MNVLFDTDHATFTAEPAHGRTVTFEVQLRQINVSRTRGRNIQPRYVVALKGSDGDGFAHFTSFESACSVALSRARRYERAFSKPRRHTTIRPVALGGAE